MKKRIIASILLLSLLAVSSCGDKNPSTGETVVKNTDTTVPEAPRDNIPEGLNLGGKTIRVYVRGDTLTTEFDAEQSGDIVDDAIFNRNRAIEERLNVDLDYFANTTSDFWGDRNIYMDTVRSSIMANDGSIDIVAALPMMMPFMAMEGLFHNLLANGVPYLDFSSPWWSTSLTDELAVDGKLYFASGEASLGVIKSMMCFYFNKNLIEDLKLENPYEIVLDGKWTLDKFYSMSSSAYHDINGDSNVDDGDRFGFIIAFANHAVNFLYSSGMPITKQNEKGFPELTLNDESILNLLNKLSEIMTNESSRANNNTSSADYTWFNEGRTLFSTGEFSTAGTFRDLTFDFGIIPYPKYDENQSGYYTTPRPTYTMFSIPLTSDLNSSSAVLEAMASESYYQVTPIFFEKALKVKYTRDDISSQMFDIIRSGVMYDFGMTYSQIISTSGGSGIETMLRTIICRGETTWASKWASEKTGVEAKLAAAIETLTNLEH